MVILDKKYCNNDSFIQRAIIKDPFLSKNNRIRYYDGEETTHNQNVFEDIFSFRDEEYRIETQENNPISLYFSLLEILCEWKTKEQIIEELNKNNELKRYREKLDNHLKILKSLGLIIEEPDFNKIKFLSLIRADCSLYVLPSASRNEFHNRDIFKQVASKTKSDLVLLKYMKRFADEDYFSYSYYKNNSSGFYKKPERQLDVLQKILKTRILNNRDMFPIHESVMAYVKGRNIRKNVEKHQKNQFILKLDFKSFFKSIKRSDFLAYLKNINFENQNFNTYIEFICDIAFKDDAITKDGSSLPIGASTSPIISNILLYAFDERISKYSHSLDIVYTRYADDLTFSHNQPNKLSIMEGEVAKVIKEILYLSDLQINNKKNGSHVEERSKKNNRFVSYS